MKLKKQNWMILITAAGVLTTSAVAGASGVIEKVGGLLRGDITVSVNGEDTSLHPVYINGKAYLPVRDTADALGVDVSWNGKQLELNDPDAEEEADYLLISGVITNISAGKDAYLLDVLGHGTNNRIILAVDKDTVVTDAEGKKFAAKDLKTGMQVTAEYGPIIALSYPGQSHAASLQVGVQRLIKEEPVYSIANTEDGWQLQFAELKDGVETPYLTLNAGKETMVVDEQGQPADWSQIKPGTKVRAYYGPIQTKSLPPQSPLFVLVVLQDMPDTQSVKEYRDLAWTFVPEDQKSHLITKKDESQVVYVAADSTGILPADDKQKQILADFAAKNQKVIAVTYNTDQDALIGPLTIVINPDTKALIGYFMRM